MPTRTRWLWQWPDWPDFGFDAAVLAPLEAEFLRGSGLFVGASLHLAEEDKSSLLVDLILEEALQTSEIEGEFLSRDSLQSSLRRHFGLATDLRQIPAAEAGIAEVMVQLYRNFDAPLTEELLGRWHRLLMNGRGDLAAPGQYRSGNEPMQIVSGAVHDPRVRFEAPPSAQVPAEMRDFLGWFRGTSPSGSRPLPILTRAGLTHLYFVCIHPFEDGNGQLARALAEKTISEGLGHATLISLSHVINARRGAYYQALEQMHGSLEVTPWLRYFAETILAAQQHSQRLLEFLIAKTKLFDRHRGALNERQAKALARVFRAGPSGFEGGLSAEKYIRLTGATRATATRDLQDLVAKGAVTRTGELKSTRYHLRLEARSA